MLPPSLSFSLPRANTSGWLRHIKPVNWHSRISLARHSRALIFPRFDGNSGIHSSRESRSFGGAGRDGALSLMRLSRVIHSAPGHSNNGSFEQRPHVIGARAEIDRPTSRSIHLPKRRLNSFHGLRSLSRASARERSPVCYVRHVEIIAFAYRGSFSSSYATYGVPHLS